MSGGRRALVVALAFALPLILASMRWSRHNGQTVAKPWQPRLVVLISIDTCRADHLGCYGYARATSPNIDRLAAQGVLFERAYSQANESLFSYGSLFTGLYPQRIGPLDYDRFRLSSRDVTLPVILSSYGVRSAGFVAGGHVSRPFGFGLGFETYDDRWDFGSFWSTAPPAMAWMDRFAKTRDRGFLFIQGYDAHAPYVTGATMREMFDPDYQGIADVIARKPEAVENICNGLWFPSLPSEQWFYRSNNGRRVMAPKVFEHLASLARDKEKGRLLSTRDIEHLVAHYDGCIAYADAWVGLIVARIQQLGLTRETLVVVMGDHGEDLMEHGFFNHRDCLADSTLHVPLIIWGPGGIPQGVRVGDVVQLVDLMPTFLDYGNLDIPPTLDGRSLRPLLQVPAVHRESRAYAEGILPEATVRARDGRLVYRGDTAAATLPRLQAARYTFYSVGPEGKEVERSLDLPMATALWEDLRQWWEAVHGGALRRADGGPARGSAPLPLKTLETSDPKNPPR